MNSMASLPERMKAFFPAFVPHFTRGEAAQGEGIREALAGRVRNEDQRVYDTDQSLELQGVDDGIAARLGHASVAILESDGAEVEGEPELLGCLLNGAQRAQGRGYCRGGVIQIG